MEAMTDTTPEEARDDDHGEQMSERVVTAVAEAKGVDPLDLDPLYSVIDPDALNSMFQPSVGSPPASMELRFPMAGCQVIIQGEGEVTVISPTRTDQDAFVTPNEE